MAAMDFPSSPTNGQVYGNYVYSTSKGAWQARPVTSEVAVISPTAPSSPKAGDIWYNSDDGCTYVYYYDGDSYQWVASRNDATFSSTLGPRVDALEQGAVNYIINGDFEINQRGLTSIANITSGGHWTADRWFAQAFGTIGVTQSRSTTVPVNNKFTTSTKFACTSTASGTGYAVNYTTRLEGYDVVKLGLTRGTPATVSFWVRSSRTGAYGITLNSGYRGGATYNFSYYVATYNISQANTWEYKTVTIAGNSSSYTPWYTDNQTGLELVFNITGGSTIATATTNNAWVESSTSGYFYGSTSTQSAWGSSTSDEFYITGVQLERGTTATAFRRNANSIQGELAACQRYYYRWTSLGTDEPCFCTGIQITSTTARMYFNMPVEMRTTPTSAYQSNMLLSDQTTNSGVLSSFSLIRSTPKSVQLLVASSAVSFPTRIPVAFVTLTLGGYVEINAEL